MELCQAAYPSPLWGGIEGGGRDELSGSPPPEICSCKFRPPHKGEVEGTPAFAGMTEEKAFFSLKWSARILFDWLFLTIHIAGSHWIAAMRLRAVPANLSVNVNAIAFLRNRRNLPWPSVEG